ncbi:MAG: MFS transporter [Bryobacteraceae bacterium]|jgi:fucose permease
MNTVDPGVRSARVSLTGFFLTGLLMSFVGAVLPVWGFHLSSEFVTAGTYFLLLNAGFLVSARAGQALMERRGVAFTAALAAFLAAGAFLYLAAMSAPFSPWWRLPGLFWLGFSAGLLNVALVEGVSPLYDVGRAATLNLAGMTFGLGCVVMSLLVAGTYYVYDVRGILILVAVIPAGFGVLFLRMRIPAPLSPHPEAEKLRRQFRSPAAVLFALLLFFQFGNEWAIAGWLPLFLIQRLGISPENSLFLLALYWTSLLLGRVVAQGLLSRMSRWRLLLISATAALLGCVLLTATDGIGGAAAGILCTGTGFAAIFPLTMENSGRRFPYYHPTIYSGIFSFAFTGGMLAPWSLGFMAQWWGIGSMIIVPMLGTGMVFLLLGLIVIEGRLSEGQPVR